MSTLYSLSALSDLLRLHGADVTDADVAAYAEDEALLPFPGRPSVTHKGAEAIADHFGVTL